MEYYKVKNCRYNYSHITSRHRCGNCKQLGHGQIECNNIDLINSLLQYNQGSHESPRYNAFIHGYKSN